MEMRVSCLRLPMEGGIVPVRLVLCLMVSCLSLERREMEGEIVAGVSVSSMVRMVTLPLAVVESSQLIPGHLQQRVELVQAERDGGLLNDFFRAVSAA